MVWHEDIHWSGWMDRWMDRWMDIDGVVLPLISTKKLKGQKRQSGGPIQVITHRTKY